MYNISSKNKYQTKEYEQMDYIIQTAHTQEGKYYGRRVHDDNRTNKQSWWK